MGGYHLGYSDTEHERLIRQAQRLARVTERFFRDAGIGPGQRVLDVGSGVGDVAMVAAKLVGPGGQVVGIERDERSIERARRRAAEANLHNVALVRADVAEYSPQTPLDAVVGRYVLQFLPDPVAVLRSLAANVRPGGVVAFQEGSWTPFVALSASLPLWSAVVSLLREAALRAGVNVEMGIDQYQVFQAAGLPAPKMRLEMELGCDPDFVRWGADCVQSVLPQFRRFALSLGALGDLETLEQRLREEVAQSNTVVPWIGLVGAWCRTPTAAA
ncbi:MAG: class I SAM-dependent methyltransferase [Candidatus Eremiobacteraeota bacterium]|nr:class I SAM-dependent methyltransferase [Candidatus Eremiobacteraeota bacterium]MBV8499623.1 class I SAM-dependent methyltransferase [Candidatus Eremiobacteraeota bacterium]